MRLSVNVTISTSFRYLISKECYNETISQLLVSEKLRSKPFKSVKKVVSSIKRSLRAPPKPVNHLVKRHVSIQCSV